MAKKIQAFNKNREAMDKATNNLLGGIIDNINAEINSENENGGNSLQITENKSQTNVQINERANVQTDVQTNEQDIISRGMYNQEPQGKEYEVILREPKREVKRKLVSQKMPCRVNVALEYEINQGLENMLDDERSKYGYHAASKNSIINDAVFAYLVKMGFMKEG